LIKQNDVFQLTVDTLNIICDVFNQNVQFLMY